jgi:hypothetical protein
MKKLVFIFLVSILLMLSACAGQPPVAASLAATPTVDLVAVQLTSLAATGVANNPTATADTQSSMPATAAPLASAASTSVELNATYENAVTVELQLLLGTLNLNGTEVAVTKEQAATLLPLWNSIKSLTPSAAPSGQGQDGATPQAPSVAAETQSQVDALLKQIEAAMTPAQIQAIAEMKITRETAMTMMQAQGVTLEGPQGGGNGAGAAGQPPQGTPPAGGTGAPGDNGGGAMPSGNGQPPSNGQGGMPPTDGGGMIPSGLIDALIQQLQKASAG